LTGVRLGQESPRGASGHQHCGGCLEELATERDILGLAFTGKLRNVRPLVSPDRRSPERIRSPPRMRPTFITIRKADAIISYASTASTAPKAFM